MPKEYIEREAALEIINSLNIASALYAGRKIINLPPAEVAPVRHAKWEEADWIECSTNDLYIRTPRGARRCSECKRCFKKELLWKDNYCPNCGCKMDLEG